MHLFQYALLFTLPLVALARRVFIYPDWWANRSEPVLIDGYEYNTIWKDQVHLNDTVLLSLYYCAHRKGYNITIFSTDEGEERRQRGSVYEHRVLWNSRNKTIDARKRVETSDIAINDIRTCYEECQVPDTCNLFITAESVRTYLAIFMPRSWNECSSDESTGSRADMYYDETTTEESEDDEDVHSSPLSRPPGQRSTFLAEAPTSTMNSALPSLGPYNILFLPSVSGGSTVHE